MFKKVLPVILGIMLFLPLNGCNYYSVGQPEKVLIYYNGDFKEVKEGEEHYEDIIKEIEKTLERGKYYGMYALDVPDYIDEWKKENTCVEIIYEKTTELKFIKNRVFKRLFIILDKEPVLITSEPDSDLYTSGAYHLEENETLEKIIQGCFNQ